MEEVEILKIGSILPTFRNKPTVMVVHNAGPTFEYYVNKLKENCIEKFSFQKTAQSIVGYPSVFRSSLIGNQSSYELKGISDGDPIIGKPYTINNSTWHTSTVEEIIDDCVIITKNSVYAIHTISKLRDEKLKNIGL
jgi:hypothetical protein